LSFAHLRRVCTLTHLPIDLAWRRDYDSNGLNTVFLLVPSSPLLPWYKICETFATHIEVEGLPRCFNAVVPRYAPISSEQAAMWTERYWPTQYNPAAQLLQDAPPLNQLRRVHEELETSATAHFLQIARAAAREAQQTGIGCGTGAVVVNPKTGQIMAVAGDARWWADDKTSAHCANMGGQGRAEHHALMRVVAMVANKELRRRLRHGGHRRFAATCKETPSGQPLTEVENNYSEEFASPETGYSTPTSPTDPSESMASMLARSLTLEKPARTQAVPLQNLPNGVPLIRTQSASSSLSRTNSNTSTGSSKSDGYLCSGLDLYLTHEPCVCCAMAMIHSRFRACVFEKRMPGSGALTARDRRDSLGYGLFWRRELNWRVMTFHYQEEEKRGRRKKEKEKYTFHA
jgi:tRNA-specific adenosine deaminase 3